MMPTPPPRWTDDELEKYRQGAIHIFREARMQEPLEAYLDAFEARRDAVETLIESTVDLTELLGNAVDVLADPQLLRAARYLVGPPVSADDLKVLADASLAPTRLRKDPQMATEVMEVILLGLDRGRFPWLSEEREPTTIEREAAIIATATLLASRAVVTNRANEGKEEQEQAVKDRLKEADFEEVPRRPINTLNDAPEPGTFCGESMFGTRKADIVIGLHDGRIMPTEAKVSNSSSNSVKRLNNDAAVKARQWLDQFGNRQAVPAAVLGGVFKLHNLRSAQDDDGLTLFWAHNLDAMIGWLEHTRA